MYPYVSIVQVLCIQREKTKRVEGGVLGGGLVSSGKDQTLFEQGKHLGPSKERVIVVI